MKTVIDISGTSHKVSRVTYKREAGGQYACVYLQVDGIDNGKCITLPVAIADRWINGEIRVKI